MRKLLFITLTACVAFIAPCIAQAQNQSYPWRAPSSQAPTHTPSNWTQGKQSTLPPIIQTNSGTATVWTQDEQDVPSPNQTDDGYANDQPGLNVQSNALPDIGTCCFDRVVPCPKRLFANRCGLEIGGWLQAGYHSDNTILFNDRAGNFDLHQFWMYFGKQTNAQNNLGYRIDAVYGIDGQNIQAIGNPPDANPSGWDNAWDYGAYGWALPQAYVEYGNGQTVVRGGKFLSPFGIEKVPSLENFFYSRTYTRVLTEPFSHTGIIAERTSGNTSMVFGATAGWDTGFDGNSGFNVITGFRTQLNPNVRIQTTSSLGDTGYRGSGVLNSFIANIKLLPDVDYAIQADYVNLNLNSNDEFGLIQYLMIHQNDCFALGARLEWWKTDRIFANTKSTWDFTVGANIRPHSNLLIRPELRWDWGAGAVNPGETIFGVDGTIMF